MFATMIPKNKINFHLNLSLTVMIKFIFYCKIKDLIHMQYCEVENLDMFGVMLGELEFYLDPVT